MRKLFFRDFKYDKPPLDLYTLYIYILYIHIMYTYFTYISVDIEAYIYINYIGVYIYYIRVSINISNRKDV